MSKKYETSGGVILADGPTDLVRKMAERSFSPADSLEAWMAQTAARAEEQVGKPIRYDNPRNFVADLTAAGLIKELQ